MTPNEIWQMWDGFQWRLDQQRTIAAVAARMIVSAWSSQPPSVDQIEAAMGKRGT